MMTIRLALVGSSGAIAAMLTRALEGAGFTPEVIALPTTEAFAAALAQSAWDLVVTECIVDRCPGADVLRALKAAGQDLPLIVVSDEPGEACALDLMRAGAHDHVLLTHMARFAPAVERELREAAMRRERHRVLEALRVSEERYRELFENATDMIYSLDSEGRFTSLNRAGEALTGYTREEAQAMRFTDLVAPEDVGAVVGPAALATSSGPHTFTVTLIGKSGARIPAEISARSINRGGRPAGVEGIGRDMTERRRLESQLRQSQKMEAIGRLAGGIAHDFNNLLTTVTGYSELLLERLGPGDPLRRSAEDIQHAATRAAALTGQLLAFSRKQVVQPAIIDLNLVVTEMERMLQRLIGEHIEFSTRFTAGETPIKADRGQVEQVVMNLVVNARDAMPHGGSLRVATSHVLVTRDDATTRPGVPPGAYVELLVEDTGAGMDADTLSHVFEPFFTTKEVGKGTGLGLSTVYGIVTQSGGHIAVASEPGQGTRVSVLLPLAADPLPRPALRRGFASLPRGTETVLLVEDEDGVRELIRDFLVRCGYTVLEAVHVSDAFAFFDQQADRISLLLTDVVMPQMNGRMLAERLLARRPSLKVLYMSGYTDDNVLAHELAQGAGFLQKPFTPDVLARKVRDVLDGTPPVG